MNCPLVKLKFLSSVVYFSSVSLVNQEALLGSVKSKGLISQMRRLVGAWRNPVYTIACWWLELACRLSSPLPCPTWAQGNGSKSKGQLGASGPHGQAVPEGGAAQGWLDLGLRCSVWCCLGATKFLSHRDPQFHIQRQSCASHF